MTNGVNNCVVNSVLEIISNCQRVKANVIVFMFLSSKSLNVENKLQNGNKEES